MRRFAPLALLLSLAAPATSPPASAEPVDLFGRTLELFLPDGYCLLDSARPEEQKLVSEIAEINKGSSQLVAYFAPCNELAALRAGAIAGLTEYGLLMVPLVNGGFQAAPGDRASTLQQIAATLPGMDEAELQQIEQQAIDQNLGVQGMQFLGLLGQDANGLYLGMLVEASDGQQSLVAAAVMGMTQLGDVVLSANLYRPYRSNADIVALVSELGPYIGALVGSNP